MPTLSAINPGTDNEMTLLELLRIIIIEIFDRDILSTKSTLVKTSLKALYIELTRTMIYLEDQTSSEGVVEFNLKNIQFLKDTTSSWHYFIFNVSL